MLFTGRGGFGTVKSCLICDDHAMMREALVGVIDFSWPNADITVAKDFKEAWDAIKAKPDLCISDLSMPGASPIDGIRGLRTFAVDTPLLIVTGNEEDNLLLDLYKLGIAGFVPKTSHTAVIEAAIRVVMTGERFIPERILRLALNSNGVTHIYADDSLHQARLTVRQIETLALVAKGDSTKEIARALDLSPSTVKAHTAAAIAALGATNRTEAVAKAMRIGLIEA